MGEVERYMVDEGKCVSRQEAIKWLINQQQDNDKSLDWCIDQIEGIKERLKMIKEAL